MNDSLLLSKERQARVNLTEWRRTISPHDIAIERLKFLGDSFVRVGPGKWRSIDGKRQFRVTPDDYLGRHGIGRPPVPNTPHVHFEFLQFNPSGTRLQVMKNVHVPLQP